jgi:hypothetical protein
MRASPARSITSRGAGVLSVVVGEGPRVKGSEGAVGFADPTGVEVEPALPQWDISVGTGAAGASRSGKACGPVSEPKRVVQTRGQASDSSRRRLVLARERGGEPAAVTLSKATVT